MTCTVVWKAAALDDLADIWTSAPDRAAVTAAADVIDATLRVDPYTWSESRSGATRVMVVPPLVVSFDVSDPDCLVTVQAVWRPA